MDLKKALVQVCKFAAKEKKGETDANAYVVVTPAVFDERVPLKFIHDLPLSISPAWVAAWDGETTCMIPLDPDVLVPAVALHAATLKKALADIDGPFSIHRVDGAMALLHTRSGNQHTVPAMNPHFVGLPMPGFSFPVDDASALSIQRVTHAVSTDENREALTQVHFAPGYVEATDEVRVARAVTGNLVPHHLLVPPALFDYWPKATRKRAVMVTWALRGNMVVVTANEEQRSAKWKTAEKFLSLDVILERKDHGYLAHLHAPAVLEAAKAAAKAAPDTDCVELAFSHGSMEVRGMAPDGTTTFSQILVANNAKEPVRVCLQGKPFIAALDALDDSTFWCFYAPGQPLRIEMEGFQELIWPMTPDAQMEVANANH